MPLQYQLSSIINKAQLLLLHLSFLKRSFWALPGTPPPSVQEIQSCSAPSTARCWAHHWTNTICVSSQLSDLIQKSPWDQQVHSQWLQQLSFLSVIYCMIFIAIADRNWGKQHYTWRHSAVSKCTTEHSDRNSQTLTSNPHWRSPFKEQETFSKHYCTTEITLICSQFFLWFKNKSS